MKLEGQAVADAEGLVVAARRCDKQGGVFRDFEGITMKLENGEGFGKSLEEGITFSFLRQGNGIPPRFFFRGPGDPGTRGPGHQLGPETDPEDGEARFEAPGEKPGFFRQKGIFIFLVNVHGAPHGDNGVKMEGVIWEMLLIVELYRFQFGPRLFEVRLNRSRVFFTIVHQNKTFHALLPLLV